MLPDAGGLPQESLWASLRPALLDLIFLLSAERKDKVFKGFTQANALGGSQRHHVRPGHAVTALSNDLRLGVFKKAFALSVLRPR